VGLKWVMKNFLKGEFFSNWGLMIIIWASLIPTFFVSTFLWEILLLKEFFIEIFPNMSFCTSNPTFLCEIPLINRFLKIIDVRVVGVFSIYMTISYSTYFIFKLLGFRDAELDTEIEEDNK
jgi:hypothetical protein